jgi:hypothetical protein
MECRDNYVTCASVDAHLFIGGMGLETSASFVLVLPSALLWLRLGQFKGSKKSWPPQNVP